MDEQLDPEVEANESSIKTGTVIAVLSLSILLAGAIGYWFGNGQVSGPGTDSVDAGFARDMMTHHAQAVDMATIIRDRTIDPDLRQIALDIMLTQQAQIGQMQGWLTIWGYPIASTDPVMAWMGHAGGTMPGMATPDQLNQLRELSGHEAEGLFLQLMILHHRGGVAMAQAALDKAAQPEVRLLAQSMLEAQTLEIDLMQGMLQQKGFPPVPLEALELDASNH